MGLGLYNKLLMSLLKVLKRENQRGFDGLCKPMEYSMKKSKLCLVSGLDWAEARPEPLFYFLL